ncbi:MAG TPA: hypothetical protein GXX39_00545 [Syntrophothermus lipocalidus]|nr:hypothetical protein [Syntrophothermus lipocalidus]
MHNAYLVQSYIPAAEKAIRENLVEKGKVKKIYKSYIAAFGPTMVQMGVLPCVAFYLNQGQAEGDRSIIVDLIAKVMGIRDKKEFCELLLSSYQNDISEFYRVKHQVEAAIVALKLVMRSYPDEKSDELTEEWRSQAS